VIFVSILTVPPVVTISATAATIAGNQPLADLTGRLGTGLAGIWSGNIIAPYVAGARVFEVNDGSASNSVSLYGSGGNLVLEMFAGGVSQGSISLGTWATGLQTIAFAAGDNFIQARKVSGSANTADTAATYPALTKANFGGQGFQATNNNYQRTAKAALRAGAVDQTVFDAIYAQAQIAADA